jgi:hypothetical protein
MTKKPDKTQQDLAKQSVNAASWRRNGFSQPLAGLAVGMLRQQFGQQLTTAQTLRLDWAEIMGAELAAVCQLHSVSRGGGVGDGKALNLTLLVEPSFALELSYQLPQLQQRVNAYFGYPAVATIRLKQQPLVREQPRSPASPVPVPLRPLPSAAAMALPESLNKALQSLQYHLNLPV